MRILIDDRRGVHAPHTGIGRFADLVVRALERHAPDMELVRATTLAGPFAKCGIASSAWTRKFLADQVVIPLRAHRVDVWHAVYYEASPLVRTSLVCCVHDLSVRNDPAHVSRLQRAYYGSLLPLLVRRARVIVVPSEATRVDMTAAFPNAPVRVVRYPVDPLFSATIAAGEFASTLRRYNLADQHYLLYTGGLHARKDIGTLLRGVARAQGLDPAMGPLVVTGPISNAFRAQAAALRCSVRCTSGVSAHVLRILYEGCTAVVNASVNEGFGYPAAEGAMLGKPVVCPDRGSLLETAGRVGVPFRSGDPAALARAIRSVLDPDEATKQAWAQEPAHAASRFSLRTFAHQLLLCYQLASE